VKKMLRLLWIRRACGGASRGKRGGHCRLARLGRLAVLAVAGVVVGCSTPGVDCTYSPACIIYSRCACDPQGRLTYAEILQPNLEKVWQRYRFHYDPSGRLDKYRWDNDGDGVFDLYTTYVYNQAGAAESALLDWEGDGTVDQQCVYEVPCMTPPMCGPRTCSDK